MNALALTGARRAIALDSTLSDAHAALGYALMSRIQFREAEHSFLMAIARDPSNPNARLWHAANLLGLGVIDSAYAESARAVAADPMSALFANVQAGSLMLLGQPSAAIVVARKAIELDSTFSPSYVTLARSYVDAGFPDSALHVLDQQRRASRATPITRTMYLITYSELDRWADIERVTAEIRGNGPSATEAVELALLNNDRQAAITALERGLTPQGGLIIDIVSPGCDPFLHSLHDEPRYKALMSRLGMNVCSVRTRRPFKTRPGSANRKQP
jgi:tetratricopeptide (TPR) repeat protein